MNLLGYIYVMPLLSNILTWHYSDEIQSRSNLSNTSLKAYQPPKHRTAIYNTLTEDFTTLNSYYGGSYFISLFSCQSRGKQYHQSHCKVIGTALPGMPVHVLDWPPQHFAGWRHVAVWQKLSFHALLFCQSPLHWYPHCVGLKSVWTWP